MDNHTVRIKELLKANPRGMTITDISNRIGINRNSVARYMDVLTISGKTEMRQLGPAKVFYLSQRVPISAMLNFSSDYILVIDNEKKILQISENLLKLVNIKREIILGRSMEDFPVSAFRSQEIFSRMRVVIDGKEIIFEKKLQLAEDVYFFNITMLPTIFEDGSQGVTLILQDITERKNAEKDIKNLAKFPSENPNPVLRLTKDGKIMYANTASLVLLNEWNRKIGQTAPNDWQQKISDVFSSNESQEFEAEQNGRQFSFIVIPVTNAGYVNIYGRDITKRSSLLEDIKEANWALRERVKELTFLYSTISEMEKAESLEDLGPKLVDFLVPAMQFPEITVPVVEIEGVRFVHKRYREELTHGIHAEICVNDHVSGRVSVYYIEDRPFIIPHEQNMVNALAEGLGGWLKRMGTNLSQELKL